MLLKKFLLKCDDNPIIVSYLRNRIGGSVHMQIIYIVCWKDAIIILCTWMYMGQSWHQNDIPYKYIWKNSIETHQQYLKLCRCCHYIRWWSLQCLSENFSFHSTIQSIKQQHGKGCFLKTEKGKSKKHIQKQWRCEW